MHFWQAVVRAPECPSRWSGVRTRIIPNYVRQTNMLIVKSSDDLEYIGANGVVYSENLRVTGACIELLPFNCGRSAERGARLAVYVWRLQRFVRQVVRPKCALRRSAVMMGCDHGRLGQASPLRHMPVDMLRALVLRVD